jgi:hypothetical protein
MCVYLDSVVCSNKEVIAFEIAVHNGRFAVVEIE